MNVEEHIYRLITDAAGDRIFRLALSSRGFPTHGPASWFRDRIRFLLVVASAPFRPRFQGSGAPPSGVAVYDPSANLETTREYRSFFIRSHFAEEVSFVWRGATPRTRSFASTVRSVRWYWSWVLVALASLFDRSSRRYEWWAAVMLDVRAFLRSMDTVSKAYVFAMYDRRSYALASYLHAHTEIEVVPVFQNIPLYRNCRYFHMRIPVVVTSRVNIHETAFFAAKGEFLASNVDYRGQEFLLDTDGLEAAPPSIDIGYFSTGEWARRDGLYQVRDPEVVLSGVLRGNPFDVKAQEILEALADYARRHQLTLRVYPHPLERLLLHQHGIEPPYAHLEGFPGVTIDRSRAGNSRASIYEPRVAVSLQSSFIWERLDLGLERSFIHYFDDRSLDPFLKDALGPYAENVFGSVNELYDRLDNAFPE